MVGLKCKTRRKERLSWLFSVIRTATVDVVAENVDRRDRDSNPEIRENQEVWYRHAYMAYFCLYFILIYVDILFHQLANTKLKQIKQGFRHFSSFKIKKSCHILQVIKLFLFFFLSETFIIIILIYLYL